MDASWSNRTVGIAFVVVGIAALILYVSAWIMFGDAVDYDAETLGGYATEFIVTSILVLSGAALVVLWRDPPVARASVFVLLAGIGAIALGVGNLLGGVFGLDVVALASLLYGLPLYVFSLLVAGIGALTVTSPNRWSGLFLLLAIPGANLGFGWVIAGVSWVLFGAWILTRYSYLVVSAAAAAGLLITLWVYVTT